jgi:hypothetical protein
MNPVNSLTTPLSWVDMHSIVLEDDRNKWDQLVPRDELRLENGRLEFPRRYSPEGRLITGLELTRWSSSQLCQRLGIPSAHFRRCPLSLQDAQVNYFLRHPEKVEAEQSETDGTRRSRSAQDSGSSDARWLLRAKGSSLRGLMSERYSRVGNMDVLQALMPVLKELGYSSRWFALTDESLHVTLIDPRRTREVLPGDAVIAGLHLANSEVGKRSITVDSMVWRLVCQNGLVRLVKGKSLFSQRHIGLSTAELTTALPAVVERALAEGDAVVDRMRYATTMQIADPEGVIATIASDWAWSRSMEEQVTASLLSEPRSQQETLYGLVNAITQIAQTLAPDERYSMESLAGTLLESGPPAVRVKPIREVVTNMNSEGINEEVPRRTEIIRINEFSSASVLREPPPTDLFGQDWY